MIVFLSFILSSLEISFMIISHSLYSNYNFFFKPDSLVSLNVVFIFQFTPDNAAPYLVFLNFASFFIGVYGLVIFMKTTSKLLTGFHIKGKFLSLQLQFILVRFHFFTFDTFGRLGYFPCHPPVSSMMTALCKKSLFTFLS